MFIPEQTTMRFDRTIFNGDAHKVFVKTRNKPVPLLFYHATNVIVGTLKGTVEAFWYNYYPRDSFYPLEVMHEGVSYCGWIDSNLVTFNDHK